MNLLTAAGLGLLLGLRHATDADHVVAVTTLVARSPSPWRALRIGAWWGVGHMATLTVLGGALVLLGLAVPEPTARALEMGVAAMLVVLGAANWVQAPQERSPTPLRPLVTGVVHGVAGTGAIALLVMTAFGDTASRLAFLAVFGVGTVLSMALFTAAMALPLRSVLLRFQGVDRCVARATGTASIAFGLALGYELATTA